MRTTPYILIVLLALLAAAFVGFLAYYSYRPFTPEAPPAPLAAEQITATAAPAKPFIAGTDPVYGDQSAEITIVEFGDFMCPACAEVNATLYAVLNEFKGKVRLVWKDLPNTSRHFLALDAAKAARCAQEQGAFWPYHDLLLARQSELNAELLPRIAQQLQLKVGDFSACLASDRSVGLIERSKNEALLLQVDATPYFFIGERRISGAVSPETLRQILDANLK
ncbi:DsbA family protein [Candidatus Uhrbacteria bacterium]|nr:DsbA family protein [Candidatus Uhrbacteria bacterium]